MDTTTDLLFGSPLPVL